LLAARIILNLQSLNGHFIPEKMGLKMEAEGSPGAAEFLNFS
jgi:hypothetical protein